MKAMQVEMTAILVCFAVGYSAADAFAGRLQDTDVKIIGVDSVFIGTVTNWVKIRDHVMFAQPPKAALSIDELGAVDTTFLVGRWVKGRASIRAGEVTTQDGPNGIEERVTIRGYSGPLGEYDMDGGGVVSYSVGPRLLIGARCVIMLDRLNEFDGQLNFSGYDGNLVLDEQGKSTFLAALASVKALKEQLDAALADVATVQTLTDEQDAAIKAALWKVEEHPADVMLADPRTNPQAWVDWWVLNRPKFLLEEVTAEDLESLASHRLTTDGHGPP